MKRFVSCGNVLALLVGLGVWLAGYLTIAGNLFEADTGTGIIYEFTPGGVRSK